MRWESTERVSENVGVEEDIKQKNQLGSDHTGP